jgi:uncharacterized membrane protein
MTRKVFILEMLLIAAALALAAIAFPRLPERIPTHWGLNLQPDGYSPRWSIFLVGPAAMAATMLLAWLLPWLSPRQFEVDAFRATYRQVMLMMFLVMTYIYAVMLWAGFGHPVNQGQAIVGGVCLFMALIGNVLGKVRRNFYIGIRTPWTLASERVWNATHRFAARTLVAGGLLGFAFTLLGLHQWPIFVLLAGALAPVIYSLVYYKQLERRGELGDPLPRT